MRVIDVGTVELNDLILSSSVVDLAETQNATYKDSRSVLLSFVESSGSGWQVFKPTSRWQHLTVDIPEGINQILLTTRGTDAGLLLEDSTAGVTMATHSHGATEDTLTTSYVLPSTGVRVFSISIDADGFVRQILFEWQSTLLP